MVPAQKKDRKYTVQDYMSWPDDERWEIIDGEAYCMSPAPNIRHQNIVGNFYTRLKTHPANRCYTAIAPTDVVFDDFNVVQPDVFLVCDKKKMTDANIQGAPDLIIEVISPSTELKDKREKKRLYERSGVKEYILANPESGYVERFVLENGRYGAPDIFNWDEALKLSRFDMEINLWEIFERERQEQAS